MEPKQQHRLAAVIDLLFYTAMGCALYLLVRYLCVWTLPFLLGAGIAVLMRPLGLRLARRLGLREGAAAILSILLFYLGAAGIAGIFLTILLAQAYELILQLPQLYAQRLAPLLQRLGDWFYGVASRFTPGAAPPSDTFYQSVADAIRQTAVDASSHLVGWCAGLAAKLPMLLLAILFTVMISLFTASSYRQVVQFLQGLVPAGLRERAAGMQRFFRETVWQMARAYTILLAVTFSLLAAGLWLLGFSYVLPIAVCITLLDILPLIGSGTILVPWALILFATGDGVGGSGLLCLFGIITVVRNVLEPRVVGKQIGLHPIATITAMYAGLQIAGVWGLLLGPVGVLFARFLLEEHSEQA
ncbi:MAG TPA: AI-2E family transporter [Candidatus Anaerotruncus excrementipullorum]|uniref:AI-2E family transporter n=1 Tax=Candidatus Anaerotruncus excrementipullorum TaxID=2838465 RepID=A0A9D1WSI0_9FIRM|nr:AI-2E family transporter [Candidatus Anaerotruncus excrementipullorum]